MISSRRTPPRVVRCERSRASRGARSSDLEAHHIAHWIGNGETALYNLLLLCWSHHRLVHEGGFSMEVTADGRAVFHRPDGSVIAEVPERPRATGPPLHEANAQRGVRIDENTCVPDWDGTRLDPVYVIDVLFAYFDLQRRRAEEARDGPGPPRQAA